MPAETRFGSLCVLVVALVWLGSAPCHAQRGRATVPHVPGTVVYEVHVEPGQVLEASTCTEHGGRVVGDTVLVVDGPAGQRRNDDGCIGLASHVRVRVGRGQGGLYRVRAECYRRSTCGGSVAVWVRDAPSEAPAGSAPSPWMRLQATAELLVGVDRLGTGGLFETRLDAQPGGLLGLHLRMSPLGLAGGDVGGIAAGAGLGYVSLELIELAVGLGGGAASLASRLDDNPSPVEPVLGFYLRFGNLRFGYLELQMLFGATVAEPMSLDVEGRIPLGEVELLLGGRLGFDGVLQGQLGALVWLGSVSRREVGVFVLGGFGGMFYQPVCRFDAPCLDTNWYLGPTLGTGVEWRP